MDTLASLLPEGLGAAAGLVLVIASFFTSALTAVFGIGGGVAMLALLGLFIPVAALIPVHGLVQLGSNTGRAWHQRAHIVRGIAAPFIAGSVVGAVVGTFFVVQLPDAVLKLALGLFVITVTWAKIPGAARIGRAGLVAGSALLALLSMFFGATGPLFAAAFSQIITDDRKALIATQAAGMTIQHALKVVAFSVAGFAFAQWLPFIVVMIASGYLGTLYGTRLLEKFPEESFRRWFRIGLTLLALDLVRRGITGLIPPL
ncbi:sulfite exporter TauE/SafE family protein [Chelativorans alearense]|uniref:sulfite exporter TauE/SafE family protein n=1 Tax=Chelativorans alearense TaxID=2681495 RepID=UPI0013D5FCA5|nr:sulfite exporter TauE/SafE family protein [Chelativorans alearense]